jgi:hypothetical protein
MLQSFGPMLGCLPLAAAVDPKADMVKNITDRRCVAVCRATAVAFFDVLKRGFHHDGSDF